MTSSNFDEDHFAIDAEFSTNAAIAAATLPKKEASADLAELQRYPGVRSMAKEILGLRRLHWEVDRHSIRADSG